MRRYIAYLIFTASIILGVGAATAPTIIKSNPDLAYAEGKTLYFKASEYDETSVNGNYELFLDENQPTDPNNEGKPVIYTLSNEIKSRLDNWGLSEYEIEVQGYDTIAVSLRTVNNTDTQYTYLERYLSFSGQDYELDVTLSNVSQENHKASWAEMIDNQQASITDIEINGYNFPVVTVPIVSGYETDFTDLIQLCLDNSTAGEEDEGGTDCSLVLWANRVDGDEYKDSVTGGGNNPNLDGKIIAVETVSNDNAVYYQSSDKDKEHPYLKLIPSSEAINDGQYNPAKAKEAYESAVFLRNMINASKYEVENAQYALNFTYAKEAKIQVEALISYGNWSLSPAMSKTLIATIISLASLCLLLALFNRILSLLQVSIVGASLFSTFATFVAFGSQLNIAAIVGLALAGLISLFGAIYYVATLKDEIYKGRTLKKAHSEAIKKLTWPVADASIVSAIIGIFIYVFAGDIVSKLGTMLVLGALFSFAANMILPRIGGWLLCNDTYMQGAYAKQLNINPDKVPNLLKEEKQTYFGPYEKKDFTRFKKPVGIIACLLILAGIGGMIGFGIAGNGDVYNDAAYKQEQTVLHLDVRSTSSSTISVLGLNEVEKLYNEQGDHSDLFHNVTIDGTALSSLVDSSSLTLSDSPKGVYDADSEMTYYWFYYEARLKSALPLYNADGSEKEYAIKVYDKASDAFVDSSSTSLNEALLSYIVDEFAIGTNYDNVAISFDAVTPEVGAPYLWKVSLGVGIGLAVSLVYVLIRFRPSRAISFTLVGASAGFLSISFFVLTRISVAPIISIGSVGATLFALLSLLFFANKEKEIWKEGKEKERSELEFRLTCLRQANSRAAGNFIIYALIAAYVAIIFFGFGPAAYNVIYLNFLIGLLFALALILVLYAPLSELFIKAFSKINITLPKIRKKKKKQVGQLGKKKSAEPEEAIFIGIND